EQCQGFSYDKLWMHSMATGVSASAITLAETNDTKMADMAFTAALMHDVGKLVLAANLPEQYGQILAQAGRRKVQTLQVEREVFNASHAELGACLLGT